MATKASTAKTTGTNGSTTVNGKATETFGEAFSFGAGFMQDNMQKAAKSYDAFTSFSKSAMDAYLQSAQTASKTFETMNTEAMAFSKQSMEETMTVTKAAMGAKSIEEVYAINTDFAKSAADAYWNQMSRMGELMTEAVRDTLEPIQGQYQEFVKTVTPGSNG